jgi:DNA-binding protein HU-beta
MTKAELIDAVKGDFSKKLAGDMVDGVFEAVKGALADDGRFAYPGFGTFTVKTRAARKGKNPRTGETIDIPASKTVVFRPASKFKGSL